MNYKEEIDAMSHKDLCVLWRFAEVRHRLCSGEAGEYLADRLFKHYGGFTPEISKSIGW